MTLKKDRRITSVVLDGESQIEITKAANKPIQIRIARKGRGRWVSVHPSSLARLREMLK